MLYQNSNKKERKSAYGATGTLRSGVGPSQDAALGGADAELSLFGGLSLMAVKKSFTCPGTSARTL